MTAKVTPQHHNTQHRPAPGAGTGKGHLMHSTPTSKTATTTRRLRNGVLAAAVVALGTAGADDAPEPTPAATSPADLDDDRDDWGDLDDDRDDWDDRDDNDDDEDDGDDDDDDDRFED
ncbi:hypothetical protein HMPREF0308_1213 [Corynebacterium striatum ATCC 6940]|nr:hypothetical protein HMPREF0308_1213 [Corynebacterium striatum ATCC 6940]